MRTLAQDRTSDDPSSAESLEGRVKGSTRGTEFIDRYGRGPNWRWSGPQNCDVDSTGSHGARGVRRWSTQVKSNLSRCKIRASKRAVLLVGNHQLVDVNERVPMEVVHGRRLADNVPITCHTSFCSWRRAPIRPPSRLISALRAHVQRNV